MSRRPAGREPYPGEIVSYDPQPRLDEARLQQLERLTDYTVRTGRELCAALRVERERAERLKQALRDLLDLAEQSDMQIHGEWGVGEYQEADEIVEARAVLVEQEKPAE